MSERKVQSKYYAPDFDPAKLPRLRRSEKPAYKVRLMDPFSMRCNTCGEWIHKGKKFNAKKEEAHGEKYLGIQIYRFYIHCPRCSAEISFKTDPENTDYICEAGASRNFEPWRDQAREKEEMRKDKQEQEENNPIKVLENRTEDSRREIQIMDALDEIRAINSIKETASVDEVIKTLVAEANHDIEALQDEAKIREVFAAREQIMRRIDEGEAEHTPKVHFFASKKAPGDTLVPEVPSKKPKIANLLDLIVKKPKAATISTSTSAPDRAAMEASVAVPSAAFTSSHVPAPGGLAGLAAYSEDGED